MANTTTRERPAQREDMARPAPTDNLPAVPEKKKHPIVAFREYMDERMATLQSALPPHVSKNLFCSVVMSALQRKPELLKCTKQSLWNACILAAQDGLLPDGREGAIVPYGENAQGKRVAEIATWMPMVEGLRKKARNSGEIASWEVNIVRARDAFHVSLGDDAKIIHEPYFGADEPGEVVGAYSIATLSDGTKMRDVMTIRDIKKIQAKSRAKNGPWSDATFFPEMCRKTMARRHYKQLPKSSELDKMIERDDKAFGLDLDADDQVDQRKVQRLGSVSAAFDQFAGPEHQPDDEPTGTQDDAPEGDSFGEFDDSAGDPQPSRADEKEAAAKAKPAAAPAPTPDDASPADDAGVDDDARYWPEGQIPTDADEYQFYAETKIAAFASADEIGPWWRSEDERRLRNDCRVTKDVFEALQAAAKARATALRKGGA